MSYNKGKGRMVYDKILVIQKVVEAYDQLRKDGSLAEAGRPAQVAADSLDVAHEPGEWCAKGSQNWGETALNRCVTGMALTLRLVVQGI
jgi:hypothetical protein